MPPPKQLAELRGERTPVAGLLREERQELDGTVEVWFTTPDRARAFLHFDRAPFALEWTFRADGPAISLEMGAAPELITLQRRRGDALEAFYPRYRRVATVDSTTARNATRRPERMSRTAP